MITAIKRQKPTTEVNIIAVIKVKFDKLGVDRFNMANDMKLIMWPIRNIVIAINNNLTPVWVSNL